MAGTGTPGVRKRVTIMLSWVQWQQAVLIQLRADFAELLQHIGLDDVDWESWRHFYDDGRTPQAAVNRALERDF
jgi:hypothetical protein